ncbi:hypothetical protein DICPUDRAFT_29220 [Dictyostelium purpureum]|uniref:dolichol kinase n=1 Tax=Dictyostelium purpureum TaxID=5786 RepID=F0ZD91_DICPU|nr:uncharacterized protein DICPUDRAFT_29220 [Dictyostelium purpureum]EGC38097.1 hypothetical protein DICPUDRAFT_29220 [Dictyostelium purpureum]|eukprot:XP_003285404.1 hypothetical protein DICPUDRAFT_29220 [Dictyostelium purpureum]
MNKKKKLNNIINKNSDNSNNDNDENNNVIYDQNNKCINHNNKLNIEFILQISISIIVLLISFISIGDGENRNLILLSLIVNIIIQFYLHNKSKFSKINNKSIIQRPLVTDWGLSLSASLLPNVLVILLYNINRIVGSNNNSTDSFNIDLVLFHLLSVSIVSPLYLLNYLSLSGLSSPSKDKSSPPLSSANSFNTPPPTNNKFIVYFISFITSLAVLIFSSESDLINISDNKIINITIVSVLLQFVNIIYILVCKQLLEKLTASFTIGEASVISQFLSILISESFRYIFDLLITDGNNNNNYNNSYKFNNLNILYCFYSLILGALLVVLISSIFGIASNLRKLVVSKSFLQSPIVETTTTITSNNDITIKSNTKTIIISKFSENKQIIIKSTQFYLLVVGVIFLIIYPVLSYQVGQNPFEWVFEYIASSQEIMWLMIIWSMLLVCTIVLYQPSIHSEIPMIISRKYFHILAIVMFTPPLLFFPRFQMNTFMVLSYAVSISALVLLELLKYSMAPPLAEPIKIYMDRFLDSRDSGIATLTHLYLLLGCSIPLFFTFFIDLLGNAAVTSSKPYHVLSPFSGIVTIGVGDTMASYFGVKYGRTKWFGSSHKSIEGTIAGSVFTILASLLFYFFTSSSFTTFTLFKIIFASTLCSVIEASTNQIDNLILPIFYFILINL